MKTSFWKSGGEQRMPSNLAIDDSLLDEALKLGGRSTKRETVNEALAEYVRRRKQQTIKELFGAIDYDPDYDYKAGRSRGKVGNTRARARIRGPRFPSGARIRTSVDWARFCRWLCIEGKGRVFHSAGICAS